MKRKRVLMLTHEELVPPASAEGLKAQERLAFQMELDVLRALRGLGHEVMVLGIRDELLPIRTAIEQFEPHIAFSLITHFHDHALYESAVISYLELLKTPYTGCNPRGLMLANDKVLSKKILAWHRVPVPRFVHVPRGRKVRTPHKLLYPLIVKSSVEDSSTGIAQASLVRNDDELRERVRFVHENIGTNAIAEEYIHGRELYVGVLGNQRLEVFPTWELTFSKLPEGSEAIATSKVKWDLEYQKKLGVKTAAAKGLDEAQTRSIARMARRIYRALGMTGYARIDLRMNKHGECFVLEVNPNPDLCKGEDFARAAKVAGVEYEALIQRILSLGLRHTPAWKESG